MLIHESINIPISETLVVTLITTFGVLITALLGYLGIVTTGARRHAKAARFGVENAHDTNLRDDLDIKFEGMEALLKVAVADIGGIRSDNRDIRREALQDRKEFRERIRDLENETPTLKRTTHE